MLVEFSVENYKSFKDRATLSMVAAKIKSEDPELDADAVIAATPELDLLRCAGIYGANASGKSNLVKALEFMRYFVENSTSDAIKRTVIPTERFKLSALTVQEPSSFEVVFRHNSTQYRYGFEVTPTKVVSEWLFHTAKKKENRLFLRQEQINAEGLLREDGPIFEARTLPNALFLSVLAQFNNPIAQDVLAWFGKLNISTDNQKTFRDQVVPYLRDVSKTSRINSLVTQFDLSLERVGTHDLAALERIFSDITDGEQKKKAFDTVANRVLAFHTFFNENGDPSDAVVFDSEVSESEGTRKLIVLSGIIDDVLTQSGVFVIDELDAKLHPLMTRAIVQLFNQASTNPNGAQLVFVTHDTNLLDKSLLRRDQIWFAEKDKFASTHLVSLVEFKPRNDAAYEKNYLQGRYGGIPFLGDITRLPGVADAQ